MWTRTTLPPDDCKLVWIYHVLSHTIRLYNWNRIVGYSRPLKGIVIHKHLPQLKSEHILWYWKYVDETPNLEIDYVE